MKRLWLGVGVLVVVCATGFFAYAWKPAIDPVEPPQRSAFDQALIEKGAVLAAVGNCTSCHTKPGDRSFAGGLAVPTPFRQIYSTNITPDPETGIGHWSQAAFTRAMREGVDRAGNHLYPAFPYDHFTLASDEDDGALYAYLMTRQPVNRRPPANELPFPLNVRLVLADWKLLFFNKGAYQTIASESAEWNRGAYLVNGLGHCGACHTPRNILGAEKRGSHLAGSEAEGWTAFALNAGSPAPVPWTHDSLFAYLRQGWHPDHGVANGPMGEATGNLGRHPDADISAMATYVASQMGEPSPQRVTKAREIRTKLSADAGTMPIPVSASAATASGRGAVIFQAACATCHDGSRPQPFGGMDFHLSSAVNAIEARFTRAYQVHGSIGPSCATAMLDNGLTTVWTHTQGVYPDRKAIAQMLGVPPEKVRCIHTEGSGCYGHNGADDAAADAALIAQSLPGTPVRVQWMRDQEHLWEPYGPAMLTRASAALDDKGAIVSWHYDLWSNNHGTRPGSAGSLIAGRLMAKHFPPDPAKLQISPLGNGDRNAIPLYDVPNQRVNWHFVADMPVRVSALRGLGAYCNVFSIESFMDELALAANADRVEYRLRHLKDPRAKKVIEVAAEKFGWNSDPMPEGRGRGFAFAKYKNHAAYLAIALEADVDRDSGAIAISHIVCAVDCGEVVAPDSIINQTEGGILQSLSWTLYEAVHFNDTRILSADWSAYPILRFSAVPDSVEVHVVDNPGSPYLGVAEAAQGPTAGAIANAFRHATGKRIHDLPYTRERVKAVLGV